MRPDEAAETMRHEANHMMHMIQAMKSREPSDFSKEDLLNWLCLAFQQHVDFKLSMADIIQNMGCIYSGFELNPMLTQATYQQSEEPQSINIEAPPFDSSFWMGLGDV